MLITPIDKYFYFIAVCILDVEDVEASQSTVILEEEEEEDRAAIVNMDSIHRVVSMSQHFSATPLSQQSGQNPLPTCSNQVGISPSPHNNQVGISPLLPPPHTHNNQGRSSTPTWEPSTTPPPPPPTATPSQLTTIRWSHSNQMRTPHPPLPPFNSQSGKKTLPIHNNQERICHPFPSQQSDENSNFPPNSKSGKFSQLLGRTLTPSLSKQQLNSSALFSPCVILRKLSGAPHSF